MACLTQFAYRSQRYINIINGPPMFKEVADFKRPEGITRCCVYSPCGRYFAWASPNCITVINSSGENIITEIAVENVFELDFSPLGTFIAGWQRPAKDEAGEHVHNLKIWRISIDKVDNVAVLESSLVGQFKQKSQNLWNPQYTHDELYCIRTVTNQIHIFETPDLRTVWRKLQFEGITDFAISSSQKPAIAVLQPERKGNPANVRIFTLRDLTTAVCQRSFFKGHKVHLKWNDDGSSLIVLARTEVDKSGKSYDEESTLYIMSADGSFNSRVELDKEGPIHDVAWSPISKQFAVVYGFMPAKTTLFDTRAVATHSFALGPRNTVLFSPQGRFILVAGFGALVGQMDVYDLGNNNQKICAMEASNATICQWSPDGRHILTATTSPRLRVDNGVRIWHVSGNLIYNEDIQELYYITWRPQQAIPLSLENPLHDRPVPHPSVSAYLGSIKTPSKSTKAYRPPGARGQVTPLAFKREDEGGIAHISDSNSPFGSAINSFGKFKKRVVPGADTASEDSLVRTGDDVQSLENLSKSALKNRKKRDSKKTKEIAEKAKASKSQMDEAFPRVSSSSQNPDIRDEESHTEDGSKGNVDLKSEVPQNHSNQHQNAKHQALTLASFDLNADKSQLGLGEVAISASSNGGTPQDKKIRALLKKLRAIDDLKMRRAGGEKLEATQIQKMDTEEDVRKALESLGWND